MTLKEISEKFPLGSLVIGTEKGIFYTETQGIVLAHREEKPGEIRVLIAWIVGRHETFWNCQVWETIEEIEPYGEIEAVKKLIEFASRLLSDFPAIICIGEIDTLKDAIDKCEGAYGL